MKNGIYLSILGVFSLAMTATAADKVSEIEICVEKPAICVFPKAPVSMEDQIKNLESDDKKLRSAAIKAIMKDGGTTVNGIKMRLVSNKRNFKQNEAFTLYTVIQNTTDTDLKMYVGHSTVGNYITHGSALSEIIDDKAKRFKFAGRGFCGTGAQPVFEEIKANSAKVFKTSITNNGKELQIKKGHTNYTSPAKSSHTFRFNLQRSEKSQVKIDWSGKPSAPYNKDEYWHGKIATNDLTINFAG